MLAFFRDNQEVSTVSEFEFASGCTNPETFPVEALAKAAATAIPDVGQAFVRYPGDLGHQGLREVMAERESDREGIDVSPQHIALTNGSMQAVTLIAEALMKGKDDVVVTEELTYSGTIGAYRRLGIELVGVALDQHGMRIDQLRTTLQRLHDQGTPPRFIYTLATYQNPTGSVMPRKRRLELIDVARQFDCIVVEDNCYGDVHYEGDKEPALYALDDSPNQVYICSLSKILGPACGQVTSWRERRFYRGFLTGATTAATVCWRRPSWPSSSAITCGNTARTPTRR